MAGMVHSTCG